MRHPEAMMVIESGTQTQMERVQLYMCHMCVLRLIWGLSSDTCVDRDRSSENTDPTRSVGCRGRSSAVCTPSACSRRCMRFGSAVYISPETVAYSRCLWLQTQVLEVLSTFYSNSRL